MYESTFERRTGERGGVYDAGVDTSDVEHIHHDIGINTMAIFQEFDVTFRRPRGRNTSLIYVACGFLIVYCHSLLFYPFVVYCYFYLKQ